MLGEGSLEVKLPTIWTDGKVGRVSKEKGRRNKIRDEKESEERRCRCAKSRKVAHYNVFPMFSPEGRQVGSLKRRVRSIWSYESSQVGSGSVGCDLGLAVEVRQCPL